MKANKDTEIVIFTEASEDVGLGHLMRCLAIGQGFSSINKDTRYIIRGDDSILPHLKGIQFDIFDWIKQDSFDKYKFFSNVAIVDSYNTPLSLCEKIYERFSKCLFFDDFNRITYPGGIVLNSVVGAEFINYPNKHNLKYLLGPTYHPFRKPFWEVQEFNINDKIENILITFGGSDSLNLTPLYLSLVRNKFPQALITVIIGSGFNDKMKSMKTKDNNTIFLICPDADEIKNQMLITDLAISAAGQTLAELARIGVPTIGVKVAENQEYMIKFWKEIGFLIDETFLESNISKEIRYKSSIAGRELLKENGIINIIKEII